MRLLLDTHVLLWSIAESRKLPAEARDLLVDPVNGVFYSAASVWEIAIKAGLARKDFQIDLGEFVKAVADTGFVEFPVTSAHAARVATLPDHHRDPFDRLLVAQALTESAVLLTNDSALKAYGDHVRVC